MQKGKKNAVQALLLYKVIILKSPGEVSLLEQPTIECLSLSYLRLTFKLFKSKNHFLGHENMKKLPSDTLRPSPKFLVLPTGQEPAQISYSMP